MQGKSCFLEVEQLLLESLEEPKVRVIGDGNTGIPTLIYLFHMQKRMVWLTWFGR